MPYVFVKGCRVILIVNNILCAFNDKEGLVANFTVEITKMKNLKKLKRKKDVKNTF